MLVTLIYAVQSLHRFVGGNCKVGVTPKATLATLMGMILTKAEPVSKLLLINTSSCSRVNIIRVVCLVC